MMALVRNRLTKKIMCSSVTRLLTLVPDFRSLTPPGAPDIMTTSVSWALGGGDPETLTDRYSKLPLSRGGGFLRASRSKLRD